jgi:uncharacterized caspase-like protein
MAVRRAVVIGVNEYNKNSGIPNLTGAVNDAKEMREKLLLSGDFEISDHHFLIDQNATCTAIRKAMSDLLWKDDASSLSLFYFSGHGLHDEYGNGYLAPCDVNPNEPLVCGIRMQELTQLLLAAKNKKTVLAILDCCYSGVATDGKAKAMGGPVAQEPPLKDWFAAMQAEGVGEGRVVLASSGKDQKSRERTGCIHDVGNLQPHDHGAFTFHLLEGIDGKAVDSNGAVTLQKLHSFISDQMQSDPYHKMSFFGANLEQAQQIILAQPCQWKDDQQLIEEVRNLLKEPDPFAVFYAASKVNTVLDRSPNLRAACELRDEINNRFQKYKNPAILWLTGNMVKLYAFKDSVYRLKELAGNLTVQTFVAETGPMQGLLISLCCMSSKESTSKEEASFIQDLRAHSSSERATPDIKTETTGQRESLIAGSGKR